MQRTQKRPLWCLDYVSNEYWIEKNTQFCSIVDTILVCQSQARSCHAWVKLALHCGRNQFEVVDLLVESFYSIKYGSSIITSNNLTNENKNIGRGFQRNELSKKNHFGILIHVLSWNIYFRLLKKKHKLKINNYLME